MAAPLSFLSVYCTGLPHRSAAMQSDLASDGGIQGGSDCTQNSIPVPENENRLAAESASETTQADATVPAAPRLPTAAQRKVVYFIQAVNGGPIKIGIADGIDRRFQGLQNQCPVELVCLATMPGYAREERALHEYFAEHRLHGEWFSPAPDILTLIEHLRDTSQRPADVMKRTLKQPPQDIGWRKYLRVQRQYRDRIKAWKAQVEEVRHEVAELRAEARNLRAILERDTKELERVEKNRQRQQKLCRQCGDYLLDDSSCWNCDYCKCCGIDLQDRSRNLCGECRVDGMAYANYTARLVRQLEFLAARFRDKKAHKLAERAGKIVRQRTTRKRTVEALRLASDCIDALYLAEFDR